MYMAHGLSQNDLKIINEKYGDDIEDILDILPGQKWMLGSVSEVTSAFFVQSVIKIQTKKDITLLAERLDEMSTNHLNLRSAIAYRNQSIAYSVVLKSRRPKIEFIDSSHLTPDELENEISVFCEADRKKGFDLEKDPLMRITVFITGKDDISVIVVSQPHINYDEASGILLFKELLIDHILGIKVIKNEKESNCLRDYLEKMQNIDKRSELEYWEHLLADSTMTYIPGRSASDNDADIRNYTVYLRDSEKKRIGGLQQRYKVTMNTIIQTAWGLYLHKLLGTEDAVFGTMCSGRNSTDVDTGKLMGCFVNVLPVRVRASVYKTFSELLHEMQMQIYSSMQKSHCCIDEIGVRIGCKGAVFDHIVNFHNFNSDPSKLPAFPGGKLMGIDTYDNLSTGFCLYVKADKDELKFKYVYDANAFTLNTVKNLADGFLKLMDAILDDTEADMKVSDIMFRCMSDMLRFYENKDIRALCIKDRSFTYKEMVLEGKRLAVKMYSAGIEQGKAIVICLEKNADYMRCIIAAVLGRYIYVPLPPEWPAERRERIVEETEAAYVIDEEGLITLENTETDLTYEEIEWRTVKASDAFAYFYTSGTSGEPKGNVISHRAYLSYLNSDFDSFPEPVSNNPRFKVVAMMYPPGFSAFSLLFFLTLRFGNAVCILEKEDMRSAAALAERIEKDKVTVLSCTFTGVLKLMMHPDFRRAAYGLKLIMNGGDVITDEMMEKLWEILPDIRVIDNYGASEMLLIARRLYARGVKPRWYFLSHIEGFILDEHNLPIKTGESGELFVGGICAQDGRYLKDEALTEDKYFNHPTLGRLFSTGDRVKLNKDGEPILMGRMDNTVKLHGLRIDLQEIEKTLIGLDGINGAAVCLAGEKPNEFLCGYYVSDEEQDKGEIRRFLAASLPYYMVPSFIERINELPVTASGKLERKSLPVPEIKKAEYVEPVTEPERILCKAVSEVLKIKERIGTSDNFFSLGGDSRTAIEVASVLRDNGYLLKVEWFFVSPDLEELASTIIPLYKNDVMLANINLTVNEKEKIRSIAGDDGYDKVYRLPQVYMKLLRANAPRMMQIWFMVKSSDDRETIQERFKNMTVVHPALRSLILFRDIDRPLQLVLKEWNGNFFYVDLSYMALKEAIGLNGLTAGQDRYLKMLTHLAFTEKMDTESEVALKLGWIKTGSDTALLHITVSHILLDGISALNFVRELTGDKPIFNDCQSFDSAMRRDDSKLIMVNKSWGTRLYETASTGSKQGSKFIFLGTTLMRKVHNFALEKRVTDAVTLQYAAAWAMSDILGIECLKYFVVNSGRNIADNDTNMIGMFNHFIPIEYTRGQLIQDVQDMMITPQEIQEVGYRPIETEPALYILVENLDVQDSERKYRVLGSDRVMDAPGLSLYFFFEEDNLVMGCFYDQEGISEDRVIKYMSMVKDKLEEMAR